MPDIMIKVTDLKRGSALDWVVARIRGYEVGFQGPENYVCYFTMRGNSAGTFPIPEYSTRWDEGGIVIHEERITTGWLDQYTCYAEYSLLPRSVTDTTRQEGATPLEAAMRCYVARNLGRQFEVDRRLLQYLPNVASRLHGESYIEDMPFVTPPTLDELQGGARMTWHNLPTTASQRLTTQVVYNASRPPVIWPFDGQGT